MTVTVPFGTNVTNLVATFVSSGSSVKIVGVSQVSGVTANNFTNPVAYTVTAGDGSTQNYVVTVTISPNTAKALTSFRFTTPAVAGTIDEAAKTVAVSVPYGTNVTALVATFVATGASVNVGSTAQVSGATANNFTSPLTYTVTAADNSTQNYVVTISVAAPSNNANLSALSVSQGTLSPAFSSATLSYTVNVANSVTSIIITGTRSDASATLSSNNAVAQNLSVGVNTITTRVTAQDGTATKDYVVTVNRAPISVSFSRLSANGTSGTVTTTALTLEFDVDPTTLTIDSISVTGATKGALSGTGTSRTLTISAITVVNGQNVTVTIANPAGFTITPPSRTVAVNYYSLGLTMVSVPAGTFQRDATAGNTSTVSAFRMSAYEITRAQFLAIMGTDPSNLTYSSGTSDPVQYTNWYHAIAFCNKLSIAEGLTPVYSVTGVDFATLTYANTPTVVNAAWDAVACTRSNSGYRLPTEMEWMWAAMGATSDRTSGNTGTGTNITGYSKSFAGSTGSNVIGDYAWTWENSSGNMKSQPVGTKQSNELGLYDMSGNVWEWCWDWYGGYTGANTDFMGAAAGTFRVNRGGSYLSGASDCTVAYRQGFNPAYRNHVIGFRVVRL